MALLLRRLRLYNAVLTAYRTFMNKRQVVKDAVSIYKQNRVFVEETKRALVDIEDFVDALRVGLNVISMRRSKNRIENMTALD